MLKLSTVSFDIAAKSLEIASKLTVLKRSSPEVVKGAKKVFRHFQLIFIQNKTSIRF